MILMQSIIILMYNNLISVLIFVIQRQDEIWRILIKWDHYSVKSHSNSYLL